MLQTNNLLIKSIFLNKETMIPKSRWIVLTCRGEPERKFSSKEYINLSIFLGYEESSYLTEKTMGQSS